MGGGGGGGGRGGGEEKMQGSTEDGKFNPIMVMAKIATWRVAARLKKVLPILYFNHLQPSVACCVIWLKVKFEVFLILRYSSQIARMRVASFYGGLLTCKIVNEVKRMQDPNYFAFIGSTPASCKCIKWGVIGHNKGRRHLDNRKQSPDMTSDWHMTRKR